MHHQIETYHVMIHGQVQGVGFRHATVRQAHALKITGWIRNLENGTVEALVQGTPDPIDEMLQWFHFGPIHARVSHVESDKVMTDQRFDRFDQR